MGHTETAESIDVSFRMWTHRGPEKHELGGGPGPPGDVALLSVILIIYRIIFRQYRLDDITASLFDVAEDSDKYV